MLGACTLAAAGDNAKLAFTLRAMDQPDPFSETVKLPADVEDALRPAACAIT